MVSQICISKAVKQLIRHLANLLRENGLKIGCIQQSLLFPAEERRGEQLRVSTMKIFLTERFIQWCRIGNSWKPVRIFPLPPFRDRECVSAAICLFLCLNCSIEIYSFWAYCNIWHSAELKSPWKHTGFSWHITKNGVCIEGQFIRRYWQKPFTITCVLSETWQISLLW